MRLLLLREVMFASRYGMMTANLEQRKSVR